MGIANIINTSTSSGGGGGEIIRELVNSSDGQGLYFSNTGYIHLANNAAVEFGTNDFSIEFILNQTGEVGSSGGSIYQSATTTNNKFSIENHVSSNVVKLIFFNAVGSATQYDLSYNMASDYNEPTHYVVSCDRSGNAVLYRNGTEVASVSIATSASINLGDGVTSTAMIGNSGSGYTFLGGLYRFRTFSKVLSHDEVNTCFQRADVQNALKTNLLTDYDLAFANPTQSLMCQDRAGNSDGTMGGTIQQTQPIVQLNSTSARIGTSAATPADGDLLVGNDLAVGGSAIGDLTVYKNATPTKINLQNSTSTNAANKGLEFYLSGNNAGIHNWQNGSMNFATNNVNRLTISATGAVQVLSDGGNNTPAHLSLWAKDTTIVADDVIGTLLGQGSDSATSPPLTGGKINFTADHDWDGSSANYQSTRIDFFTQNNSGTDTLDLPRMSIANNGVVTIKRKTSGGGTGANTTLTLGIDDLPVGTDMQAGDGTRLLFKIPAADTSKVGASIDAIRAVATDADSSTNLRFMVSQNDETLDTAMTISSAGVVSTTGNVAINHASPNTQLDIKSTPLTVGASGLTKDNCRQLGLLITPGGTGSNTNGDIYSGFALGDGYAGMYGYDDGSGSATGLGLFTGNGTTVAERLKIDSSGLATFSNGIALSGGITTLGSFTELTIASGAVTVTSSVHRVDTEGNAGTDDLDTINGGTDGSILILSCADNGRDVVFKDGTGNLKLNGDFTATNKADTITLVHYGSEWREVSRSDNA